MRMSEARRRPRHRRSGAAALALAAVASLGLTACQSGAATPDASTGGRATATGDTAVAPAVAPVHVTASVKPGASDVPVDREVAVSVQGGSLTSVSLRSAAGSVAGKLAGTGSRWAATGRLEPGAAYVLKAVAKRSDGKQVTRTRHFRTQDLTLAEQTYPSVAPLQGETVGVGMPVIVTFDVPVTNRAAFEKHMSVTSTPHQVGSWHWLSATEVHWRPRTYWKAGTDVHVNVDVNSIPAGNGVFGQESRSVDFHVGDAHVYKVNAQTDQMRVFSNGQLLRTVPVTTGKPGFTTRSGTKIIIEKFPSKRMNSETVGITGAEAYNIGNVQWAMRLTYSGEFLHAAPWSVADQGHANVSHGCTGMSTANAAWLYAMTRRGDVVETTGTDRPMTLTNGYGDWNESFSEWRQGSALS